MIEELMHSNLKAKEIEKIMKLEHKQQLTYLKEITKIEKDMVKFNNQEYLSMLKQIKKEQLERIMGYD